MTDLERTYVGQNKNLILKTEGYETIPLLQTLVYRSELPHDYWTPPWAFGAEVDDDLSGINDLPYATSEHLCALATVLKARPHTVVNLATINKAIALISHYATLNKLQWNNLAMFPLGSTKGGGYQTNNPFFTFPRLITIIKQIYEEVYDYCNSTQHQNIGNWLAWGMDLMRDYGEYALGKTYSNDSYTLWIDRDFGSFVYEGIASNVSANQRWSGAVTTHLGHTSINNRVAEIVECAFELALFFDKKKFKGTIPSLTRGYTFEKSIERAIKLGVQFVKCYYYIHIDSQGYPYEFNRLSVSENNSRACGYVMTTLGIVAKISVDYFNHTGSKSLIDFSTSSGYLTGNSKVKPANLYNVIGTIKGMYENTDVKIYNSQAVNFRKPDNIGQVCTGGQLIWAYNLTLDKRIKDFVFKTFDGGFAGANTEGIGSRWIMFPSYGQVSPYLFVR
jgi:hypothetical protein